mmetsp:Transcript_72404/g.84107  ORF Transcript_72404/g.84107 Transcript_72404/m.84107 type:complete len:265 (+) Transcript_72404:49-843(+)
MSVPVVASSQNDAAPHRHVLPMSLPSRKMSIFDSFFRSKTAISSPDETVAARRLKERQAIPKNTSPFLAADFLPMLPPKEARDKDRVSLAIDLDETLVYAQSLPRKGGVPAGMKYDVLVEDGDQLIVVRLRPYLREFLEFVSERFEAILFTAGLSSYADPLLARVDPEGRLLRRHLRLYRQHCADMSGKKVKDLGLLGRPLHRIALLDNTPTTYAFQPRNGIPIVSWYGEEKDTALLDMMPLLQKLSSAAEVYDVLDWYVASCK